MDRGGQPSRIHSMEKGAAAGIYSYKSPYSQGYADEHGDANDEVDLGEADDPHRLPPSLRPSVDYVGNRPLVMPMPSFKDSVSEYTEKSRGSKFTEVFRSLSTSLAENSISRSLRGRDSRGGYRATGFSEPQSRPPVDELAQKYGHIPRDCHSRYDVSIARKSWLYICQVLMGLYAAAGSTYALYLALHQTKWGPGFYSTPIAVANLMYKTIEVSFVAVFVTFLGQVLTRRAFSKSSRAVNVAELMMRSWVNQPGSMLTNCQGLPHAGGTVLGALTILATIAGFLHSTACGALVTPKLLWADWKTHDKLNGLVRTSYANIQYVKSSCPVIDSANLDPKEYPYSCLNIQFSGNSYRTLISYLDSWENLTASSEDIFWRPDSTSILFDNTTLESSWGRETPPAAEVDGRIINSANLIMPHAGISSLYATNNTAVGLLEPNQDLKFGAYALSAGVVSPAISVMCVNTAGDDLLPLVNSDGDINTTDTTPIDDIFEWGDEYGRYRPAFGKLPIEYNLVTDTQSPIDGADSIYILANSHHTPNYTLCELRSFVTPHCLTVFEVSPHSGHLSVDCGNKSVTKDGTYRYYKGSSEDVASPDWRNLAVQWRLSMDLNGGMYMNNASNARLLTDLILLEPNLLPNMPSLAEALAVYASSTLIAGSLSSTYSLDWPYGKDEHLLPGDGVYENFNATYRTQQYISAPQPDLGMPLRILYFTVLVLVLVLSLVCVWYHILGRRMVTDFTDPQNLFTLAINSPPSRMLQGACGRGPEWRDLGIAFRVAYSETANHYFFEDAEDAPLRSAAKRISRLSHSPLGSQVNLLAEGTYSESYKRLSSKNPIL